MDHKSAEDQLSAFYDCELSEKEHREVAVHVQECRQCRQILAQFGTLSAIFSRAAALQPSESFTDELMERLATLEASGEQTTRKSPFSLQWLFPVAGYGFALFLMFAAITHWEPYYMGGRANTETILLSGLPQESHWTFSKEKPEVTQLWNSGEEL